MSIHPRHLRGNVGTHPHQTPGELIGDLEGFPLQIPASPIQQGFQKFDQWREDQFVTPALVQIQGTAPQLLNRPGAARQDFFHPIGE